MFRGYGEGVESKKKVILRKRCLARFLGIMGRKTECVWVGVCVRVITAEKR